MSKGFTPLFGLAVVVALALAAVFGALSIANPAMAAIGQPADAALSERTSSPQVKSVNLSVTPGERQVTLKWKIPGGLAAGGSWSSRYREDETGTTFADTPGFNANTCPEGACTLTTSADGLNNGVTYLFQVIHTSSGGTRDAISALVSGTPNNAPVAGTAIENLALAIAEDDDSEQIGGALTVSWNEVTSDDPDKWQYRVTRSADTDFTPNITVKAGDWEDMVGVAGDDDEYTITGLKAQIVTVQIRGVNEYTTGNVTGVASSASPANIPLPAMPTGVKAVGADKAVNLSWDKVEDGGITGWEYREKSGTDDYGDWDPADDSAGDPVASGGNKAVVSGLDNGTEYTFQVRAVRDVTTDANDRDGIASAAVMATPMKPTPATVDATGIIGPGTLAPGATHAMDLSMYFTDGVGIGAIDHYKVTVVGDSIAISGLSGTGENKTTETGMISILAQRDGYVLITVEAEDGVDKDGAAGDGKDNVSASFTVTVAAAAVNTPAKTVSFISNQTMTVGDSPSVMDVGGYFKDGQGSGAITGYSVASSMPEVATAAVENNGKLTVTAVAAGSTTITVTATDGNAAADDPTQAFTVTVGAAPAVVEPPGPYDTTIEAGSLNPGKNTNYTVKFNAAQDFVPGLNDIAVQFTDGDWIVPESINESSVIIEQGANVANPASVSVDDQEITLQLQDMDGDTDGIQGIASGSNVKILFRTSAGIKNPLEGGEYKDMTVADMKLNALTIRRTVGLSEEDGGRGTAQTATGKGFKNGTTVTFVKMTGPDVKGVPNFDGATSLCSAVAADGVATCDFTVTSPLFTSGMNYVNAFDGRSGFGTASEPFELTPSIGVSPTAGSPGESILIQLYDFPGNAAVTAVNIARRTLCTDGSLAIGSADDACGTVGNKHSGATGSFRLVIPNKAPLGVQDLQVKTTDGADNTNIVISGPMVTSTPSTVLANQRVSLVGTGFTTGSIEKITFAGKVIDPDNYGGAGTVRVDGGGNWNASVNLPLNTSTVSAGEHAIQVTDKAGRVGQVKVTVPERSVSITPVSGRVGTIAVVRGENFPSKNDEGVSFNITVIYGTGTTGSTTVSAVPDASGRFEVQLRIPTTAAIPSTNDVSVRFGEDSQGGPWTINVSHDVPEGIITLSQTSGGPGSMVNIEGEGFRSFVPVSQVMIGSIDITPTPKPSTDVNGMINFDVMIPGLDVGIHTIEVKVGSTTASAGFTVTESGVNPGDIMAVADAIEAIGDNLVSVWHFNNDTKVWSFYSPELAEDNTLTHMITGETYLIQVKASQEVILNRDTRSLTCVGGNCWNQIVW